LVQGLTLAPLIRILKLERFDGAETATLSEADARARLARAQLAAIQRVSARDDGTQRHPRLLEQFSYRVALAERSGAAEAGLHRHEHFSAVLTAIEAGRVELVRLHRRGKIHDSVLHALETELDLQETAARRHTVSAG
jgi:CPA1 family monovalent cation:H+ antiporter